MKRASQKALALLLTLVFCLGSAIPALAAYEHSNGKCTYELSNAPIGTAELRTDVWSAEKGEYERVAVTVFVVPDNTLVTSKTVPDGSLVIHPMGSREEWSVIDLDWTEAGEPFEVIPDFVYGDNDYIAYKLFSQDLSEEGEIPTPLDISEGGIWVVAQSVAEATGMVVRPLVQSPVVMLSPQNLAVNGKTVDCEKYNIDGANYFKLRDLAQLLNGTASQFEVGYDQATKTVTITTGKPYTSNGTELAAGVDNSSTAQPSSQTILIDGVERGDLAVYNIGGSNFFKLRDLGDALGFTVGYDETTKTATVTSAQ